MFAKNRACLILEAARRSAHLQITDVQLKSDSSRQKKEPIAMDKKSTPHAAAPNSTEAKNEASPVASSATTPGPPTKESLEALGFRVLPPSGKAYGLPMGMPLRPNVDGNENVSSTRMRDDLYRQEKTPKRTSPKPSTE